MLSMIFYVLKGSRRVRLIASPPPLNRLCRKCRSLDVSQTCRPLRSVTEMALLFYLLPWVLNCNRTPCQHTSILIDMELHLQDCPCELNDGRKNFLMVFLMHPLSCHWSTSNYARTVSFHIFSNSLFIVVQSSNTTQHSLNYRRESLNYLFMSLCLWLYIPLLGLGLFFSFLVIFTVNRTP
jgi:hypothetical protein